MIPCHKYFTRFLSEANHYSYPPQSFCCTLTLSSMMIYLSVHCNKLIITAKPLTSHSTCRPTSIDILQRIICLLYLRKKHWANDVYSSTSWLHFYATKCTCWIILCTCHCALYSCRLFWHYHFLQILPAQTQCPILMSLPRIIMAKKFTIEAAPQTIFYSTTQRLSFHFLIYPLFWRLVHSFCTIHLIYFRHFFFGIHSSAAVCGTNTFFLKPWIICLM